MDKCSPGGQGLEQVATCQLNINVVVTKAPVLIYPRDGNWHEQWPITISCTFFNYEMVLVVCMSGLPRKWAKWTP